MLTKSYFIIKPIMFSDDRPWYSAWYFILKETIKPNVKLEDPKAVHDDVKIYHTDTIVKMEAYMTGKHV